MLNKTDSSVSIARPVFAGTLALGFIFAASAVFTWSYFTAGTPVSAQTATVEQAAEATTTSAFSGITLIGQSAIVFDATTGKTLYTHNPDVQWPLASLTKVALVLSVTQVLPLDTTITIPYDTGSSGSYRLLKGQRWTLQNVINFTLPISSNDGADIIAAAANSAIHAAYPNSPAQNATVWRMNDLAKQLGLQRTYFLNPSGLDESATQSGAYGSARDIAALFSYAAQTESAVFAATTKTNFTLTSEDGQIVDVLNTDEALPAIPGMIMGKTGYTDLAGGNLAVVFRAQNGDVVTAVVLGSSFGGRFSDMEKLVSATQRTLGASQ